MTVGVNVLKVYESFILGYCKCGCNQPLDKISSGDYLRKQKRGHNLTGSNNKRYNNGIRYRQNYRYIYMPDYFSAQKDGYVPEHIYNYQEYYKVCILSGYEIHHIEPVRKGYCNNMVWNLLLLSKADHRKLDRTKDSDGWRCSKCGLGTYIKPNGRPMWYYDKDGNLLCNKCDKESKYVKKERKKKDWTGTICFLCGSNNAVGLSRHGSPHWRRLDNDPNKPICNKCNKKIWRKKQKNK